MSLWGKTDTSGDEPKFGAALNSNTSETVEVLNSNLLKLNYKSLGKFSGT